MESLASYLRRKCRELRLVEACLSHPASDGQVGSIEEAIERKFRAGAALKAEYARGHWALTETHWADTASFKVGQFEVGYTYQRADLTIGGSPLYEALPPGQRIIWSSYTSSGMSALTTILLALGRNPGGAVLLMRPDSYTETRQLVDAYGGRIGIVPAFAPGPSEKVCGFDPRVPRVLLLDSGVPKHFSAPDSATAASADLLLFDTTCLTVSSGRVAQVLRRAEEAGLPSVLVRSHTKLDSLGIEYGRLGSVVILVPERTRPGGRELADRLAREAQDAVRLFGAAAVPAHLPPFMGGAQWRPLYRRRVARIIRNNRRAARRLSLRVPPGWTITCYQHGLFLTLDPGAVWDQPQAGDRAESLVRSLRGTGLPVRHAGSFGFDFAVVDAFPALGDDRFILRLAMADLPGAALDAIVADTAAWAVSAC